MATKTLTTKSVKVSKETISLAVLEDRREALVKERDAFLEQANRQLAAYDGALQELNRMIGMLKGDDEEAPAEADPQPNGRP